MDISSQFGDTLKQAMAASADGRSDEAIDLFRRAAEEQPGFAVPPFLLGAELAQLGRIEEAMQAYAGTVLLAPDLHVARFQLGLLQFTSGHAALALITWQPLLQLPENDAFRAFVLGFTAMAGDQFQDAIHHFRAGQKLNTENAPLNADIEMVIGKIQELIDQQPPASGDGTANKEEAATEEGSADVSHVLLSNYRGGSFH